MRIKNEYVQYQFCYNITLIRMKMIIFSMVPTMNQKRDSDKGLTLDQQHGLKPQSV